ncbi:Uncharacterized protein OS=Planctomyces maris DSM 8797 GN=PM8797T_00884 PE=4 SV=1 [Gemmata massiliana]|uniref:Uncharacterized protein n=1 Tax=Gemmata massiliana TaxID=1210884 RepID=A0A6P2D2J9_9BACT|nr:hypothetical protein [Gemmata massiliana]VTR93620.1 Uncharacterized protein OS=Planctomyces maris DSM 8797 GN=PM8797T_00884 PE=4 SV=1 [Gemmata massiliana]
MRVGSALLIALVLGSAIGCGSPSSGSAPKPAALTVNDWKAMPPDQKYTPETLERLKSGDPSLETAEGWEAFQKNVVIPARRKDFPNKR